MLSDWNQENYHPTSLMRAIQVFLLVLIVVGVGLLLTQKTWVPKVTTYILQTEIGHKFFPPITTAAKK